ncbi:sigma-54-dependent transcriptional regulator [Bacteroidota bacterium]
MEKLEANILVIDDDKDVLHIAHLVLSMHFTNVVVEQNPDEIVKRVKNRNWDVVLLDMNFKSGETDGSEGIEYLQKILTINPGTHVLLMTAYGDIDLAVEAMKIGATDFITKPWNNQRLLTSVNSVLRISKSKKEIDKLKSKQFELSKEISSGFSKIISVSPAMNNIFNTINKVAETDANILITGENGTGKELIAREIHGKSKRKNEVFINIDLGAIPESLFESELFGYEKGAFTDAKNDKAGKIEIASGGTLFLDEIGNLSFNSQVKLLTVLQNKQLSRIGSVNVIDVDFRLICATNMAIYDMVNNNNFRQDLLYRINTVEINLPPLRNRKEDISPIVNYYLDIYRKKYNKFSLSINDNVIKMIETYNWPGNIRELIHSVERAVIMCDSNTLGINDFLINRLKHKSLRGKPDQDFDGQNIQDIEKEAILKALNRSYGNYTKAAEELGWVRSTLYRKRKKYGI